MKVTGHQSKGMPSMGRVAKTAHSALQEAESPEETTKRCQMDANDETMLQINIV